MSGSHFVIWCGIVFSVVSNAFIAWHIHQLHSGQSQQAREDEQILMRLIAMERWAAAHVAFATGQTTRIDDVNKRLVVIETENKEIIPKKREDEDDPFSGPRSWSAQAAAAERGEGVRIGA